MVAGEGLFMPIKIYNFVLRQMAQEGKDMHGKCLKRNKIYLERNIISLRKKLSPFQVSHLSFLLHYYFDTVVIIRVEPLLCGPFS